MMPSITLTTDRLTLRTPVEADYPAASDFMMSRRASFVGGPLEDEFDRWRGFLGALGHWCVRGYGFFTVLHGDRPVGRVGVVNHIMWDEPELGWHLFDGCEGHGFATEAAFAARAWAAAEHGLGPLVSNIHPDNAASRRVAQRLGARLERVGTLLDTPCEIWRHPAEVPA